MEKYNYNPFDSHYLQNSYCVMTNDKQLVLTVSYKLLTEYFICELPERYMSKGTKMLRVDPMVVDHVENEYCRAHVCCWGDSEI